MREIDITRQSFENHRVVVDETISQHTENIILAANLVFNCFQKGGRLVLFGNGGSAADSQHLAAEFIGRFILERKSLPAIALTTDTSILTAIGNDYGFEYVFERQVESIVNKNDIIVAISTSGNSENVIRGVIEAKNKGAMVIAMTGKDGGRLGRYADVLINIPSKETPRIQEMHTLVGHTISNIVEQMIADQDDADNRFTVQLR